MMPPQETSAGRPSLSNRPPRALPKLCGADIELANFFLEDQRSRAPRAAEAAAMAVLREIGGVPGRSPWAYDPQDRGRKFLASNGGCAYIDLDHLELCLPEVVSAFDHVACWHAMLRIAADALEAANEKFPSGRKIKVLVNNSDGQDHSYGSHLSFLITRQCRENIFERKLHYLLQLSSYLASSIVFGGAGKAGSENGRPNVSYQIAQRADFIETLTGEQTTYHRPLVNARDESLADRKVMARFHCIFFDNTLCHGSSLLKVGVTQIVLAMIEQEALGRIPLLDDPLEAAMLWSHDPDLKAFARLLSGGKYRALDMQWTFFERASRFVATGRAEGIVPRAQEIMALWEDTLSKLEGNVAALVGRLDWVLKRAILERAVREQKLQWDSAEVKLLDHLYSSLDGSEGLYWAYERLGIVERIVSSAEIERFVHEPPEDTRAWTRAHLLRLARPGRALSVDWDSIQFAHETGHYWPTYRTCELLNPLAFHRAEAEPHFAGAASVEEVLDRLELNERKTGTAVSGSAGNHPLGADADSSPSHLLPARSPCPNEEGRHGKEGEGTDQRKEKRP